MSQIVWWEIETRAPEVFQEFHGAMWGWTFQPAFVDTELDADYWIIKVEGPASEASSAPPTTSAPMPAPDSM